jgi:hypothetical protein
MGEGIVHLNDFISAHSRFVHFIKFLFLQGISKKNL